MKMLRFKKYIVQKVYHSKIIICMRNPFVGYNSCNLYFPIFGINFE